MDLAESCRLWTEHSDDKKHVIIVEFLKETFSREIRVNIWVGMWIDAYADMDIGSTLVNKWLRLYVLSFCCSII
jgi:hypothetical protein